MSTAELQLDNVTFAYVRDLVCKQAGIALAADKDYLVESRLLPLAKERGFRSIREFISELRQSPFGETHALVVEAMATNETSFFRDAHPFRALKDDVLPSLVAARRAARTITIWSAACSTGQEPYSIAILLAEHFPQLADWHIQILASDMGRQVLSRAKEGEYTDMEVSRGLTPGVLARHFERRASQWRIKTDIRKRVRFLRLNLIDPWPPMPKLDIVFLRNVLIYFAPEPKRRVLANLRQRMAADGVLILGGAESTLGIDDAWQRVSHGKTSSYRIGLASACSPTGF
jgi:chemotaxis protein methyltransferase CheR